MPSIGREITTLTDTESQYSLIKILTIWVVVSLPMLLLIFFGAPFLASHVNVHPFLLIWYAGIAGMAWQFIVSVWILHDELDEFTWQAIKERIWLVKPSESQHRQEKLQTVLVANSIHDIYIIFRA